MRFTIGGAFSPKGFKSTTFKATICPPVGSQALFTDPVEDRDISACISKRPILVGIVFRASCSKRLRVKDAGIQLWGGVPLG
jgi:hypothetical protein